MAAAVGAEASGVPQISRDPSLAIPQLPRGHIGLNPVVRGPRGPSTRAWPGFGLLAQQLRRRWPSRSVVAYAGPGEQAALEEARVDGLQAVGLSLGSFVAALTRCAVFVSNDSGAAHVARACGVPTVVVYGSTRPEHTGPDGARSVVGPPRTCSPCYRQRCPFGVECLDIPVDAVASAVDELLADV